MCLKLFRQTQVTEHFGGSRFYFYFNFFDEHHAPFSSALIWCFGLSDCLLPGIIDDIFIVKEQHIM